MTAKRTVWQSTRPAATTGRPAERDRSDFVLAAMEIAERDGLDAVTMRRLAAALGAGAASAYRHVGSRDDLVDLMIDRALEGYQPPEPVGEPYDDVAADLLARLRFVREHPWLVDALEERPTLSPQRIRLLEASLERLAGLPAPGPVKIEALTVAGGMLSIQLRHEQAGQTLDPDVAQAQLELLQQSAGDGTHPHLAAALGDPPPKASESPDDRFVRVVRRILEGLL